MGGKIALEQARGWRAASIALACVVVSSGEVMIHESLSFSEVAGSHFPERVPKMGSRTAPALLPPSVGWMPRHWMEHTLTGNS